MNSTLAKSKELTCWGEYVAPNALINKYVLCAVVPIDWVHRTLILPILIISGLFGNIITIMIFAKLKANGSTFRIYFLILAISDLCLIITYAIPDWTNVGLGKFFYIFSITLINFAPEKISIHVCLLQKYLWNASWFISYWILLAYSIERLIAISVPFMRIRFITTSNACKICLMIVLVGQIGFSPIFYGGIYELKNADGPLLDRVCSFRSFRLGGLILLWYITMNSCLIVLIPPIAVAITNLILLIKVVKVLRERKLITHSDSTQGQTRTEVKKAQDVLWLSLIMVIFSFPILSWIAVYLGKSMNLQ